MDQKGAVIKTHRVSKNGPRLLSHQLNGWCWYGLRLTFLEEAYFKREGSYCLCILFPDHTHSDYNSDSYWGWEDGTEGQPSLDSHDPAFSFSRVLAPDVL